MTPSSAAGRASTAAAEAQADELAQTRLPREARAAASLDHAYICAVYEVGETEAV